MAKNTLIKSDFNRSFGKLFSTGILVAVVGAIFVPIISRLYSPAELGGFQLLLSMVVVFSSVSSFRYEMAIVLPKKKYQSNILLKVAIFCLFFSTVLFSICFYFFSFIILSYFNAEELLPISWVIPLCIVISGGAQILQMLLVSCSDFNQLSVNKASQSLVNNSFSALMGSFNPSVFSLACSYMGSLLFVFVLTVLRLKKIKIKKKIGFKLMLRYLLKYKKFPTINTLSVFLNTISINLPVFVLSKSFSIEVVGIYMMASRLMDMPTSIISSSFNQVFTKFAADDYNKSAELLKIRYVDTFKKLSFFALFFVLFVWFFYFFDGYFLLGSQWEEVGEVMFILAFSKAAQLLNSPLSSTLNILNKQEVGLFLVFLFLVIRFLSLVVSEDYLMAIFYYSISTLCFYSIYNFMMFRLIK
jgi:lipopolysaccharide exporter